MKGHFVALAGVLVIGLAAAGQPTLVAMASPIAAAGPAVGHWSPARQVPGTLSTDSTYVNAVSCVSRGACIAGGYGVKADGNEASFVVSEQRGRWGKRQLLPELESFSGSAIIEKLACPARGARDAGGDCLAAGEYGTGAGDGFVMQQAHGIWAKPLPIPGLATLNRAGQVSIDAVACPAPGHCTVTGTYETPGSKARTFAQSAFISDEVGYRWRTAIEVPGLAALNGGHFVAGVALTCPSPGDCTLAGEYAPGTGGAQVFVDSEVKGHWQRASAARIPGLAKAGIGLLTAPVACAARGNCVTAGVYTASAGGTHLVNFLLTQTHGRWATATTLPGMQYVAALACPASARCVAGGPDSAGIAAIVRQEHGTWGHPAELPGATRLRFKGKPARFSEVDSLACPSPGNCSADGTYRWGQGSGTEVFVAGQSRGAWSPALTPAGEGALDVNADAFPTSLSCAEVADCALAASSTTASGTDGAILVTETPLETVG
jgi:hypothetical protein